VKGTRRWLRGRNGELIKMKSGELGGNDIRLAPRISGTALRGDRILLLVVQPGVEEGSRAVHLGGGDIGVPVGHGSEAGPGVEVDAGEAESWRNDGAGLLPIGPEALAVLVELGVEAARAPAGDDLLDRRDVHTEQIAERFEVRGERDDDADVQ